MILVTGGAGYIGSHTVKELLRAGHDVVVFDNLSTGHRELVLARHFFQGDLLNPQDLERVFSQYKIDAVLHFAAATSVPESVENPEKYYRVNVLGTLNLLSAMVKAGVKYLVFSSSAAVYGDPQKIPIPEDHPKNPKNPYGRTKWMMEQAIYDYAEACGLKAVCLRYFNAAGSDPEGEIGEWHSPETHLIPIVLEVALGKRPYLEIFGTDYETADGTPVRDYIHVCDLAKAHVLALHQLLSGRSLSFAYNLGIGRGYSVKEVLEVCRRVTGREIPAKAAPRRPGDPAILVADPTRAQNNLGWQPRYTTLEPIVETAWNWILKMARKFGPGL